jgi:uncharacterized protein (TIGR03382 family)
MLHAGAPAAGAVSGHHPVPFGHTLHGGLESYVVLALAGTLGYLVFTGVDVLIAVAVAVAAALLLRRRRRATSWAER